MDNYLFKVLMGGCVGTTRSEIMGRFTSGQSHSDTRIIIGVDFAVHCVDLPENESATLQLWDFGEEERFRTLIPGFCVGASGAILFLDYTRSESLYELESWISIIREHTNNIPIVLCGANCGEQRQIHEETILNFITKHKLDDYLSISMDDGCEIDTVFEVISEHMVKQWPSLALRYAQNSETIVPHQPN